MKLLEYFPELSLRPENAGELKGLILQLAVQGKLTQQWRAENPELISGENSAEALLEQIKEEKAKLVREKNLKKEKPFTEISSQESLFTLPEAWTWCRLIDASEYIQRGKSPKYSETSSIPVVSQKCVQWTGFDISRARFIREETLEKYQEERFLQVGDLLWNSTGDGTIGRVTLFPGSAYDKVVADSHVTIVRPIKGKVLPDYLRIFSASPSVQESVLKRVSGSTKQTELATGIVKALPFALPPLAEQKAIVTIVEQLLAEVDQLVAQTQKRLQLKRDYATASLRQLSEAPLAAGEEDGTAAVWAQLAPHFRAVFDEKDTIQKLRETILTLAVQGKLTQQWRAENPELISGEHSAEALLEQIKEEKAKLLKEKNLKNEKPLTEISSQESLFTLPEDWTWCRLIDASEYIQRGKSPKYSETSSVPVVSQKCVQWTGFDISRARFIREETLEKYQEERFLQVGDLLWNSTGDGTIGRVTLFPGSAYDKVVADSHVTIVRPIKGKVLPDYLRTFTASPSVQESVLKQVSGSTKQTELATGTVKALPFAFPPLAEQKAIVGKVNRLMAWCNELEAQVGRRQELLRQTMQAVKREVLTETKEYAQEESLAIAAEEREEYNS